MGRPDTLGADLYHNRRFPLIKNGITGSDEPPEMLDPAYCAVIKCAVDLARITKTVCLGLYVSDSPAQKNVALVNQIEQDLDLWFESIPSPIRPSKTFSNTRTLKAVRDALYVKRQRLAVTISKHSENEIHGGRSLNLCRIP
jgi:hypothetical protein